MTIWRTICDCLERGDYCAMVSVLEARGSAPRDRGARMVILQDGAFTGTIGGGALEWKAMANAKTAIAKALRNKSLPPLRQSQMALGPDLGQCCGGSVRLLLEVFAPAQLPDLQALAAAESEGAFTTQGRIGTHSVDRVILNEGEEPEAGLLWGQFGRSRQTLALFGAGHVGRSLILALAPLDFQVVWIDSRASAFPSAVPGNVKPRHVSEPAAVLDELPDGALILVLTHSHALDFDIVMGALAVNRFAYVGLIGSDTKRARFRSRLHKAGLGEAAIGQLVCPIGIPGIRSKEPAAIAASVVADLLCRVEQWRSGRDEEERDGLLRLRGGR